MNEALAVVKPNMICEKSHLENKELMYIINEKKSTVHVQYWDMRRCYTLSSLSRTLKGTYNKYP